MPFTQFPNTLQVKVIETGELVPGGSVQVAKSLEMQYMQLVVYINGTLGGTEQLRIRLFPDQAMAKPALATSAWASLSAISNLGTYWIGHLRFDFNREQLNQNTAYWVGIDAQNYTRNGNTFYLGVARDYSLAQSGNAAAASMALYGYRYLG